MPHRKKTFIRKKKVGLSSSFEKSYSENAVKNENNVEVSKAAKDKRPSVKLIKPTISHNYGYVKRIYSPFNRFSAFNTETSDINKVYKKMPHQSSYYKPTGLTAKEKSYVICSCQSRSSRYIKLKKLALDAIKTNKIFMIYGACSAVRRSLIDRGWVEKITPAKMNLSMIRNGSFNSKCEVYTELERLLLSNLVEKYSPNFIWRTKDDQRETTIDMNKDASAIINKLKIDAQWTSKQGLCLSMKRNYWFYIENVAEVNGPRTYNTYDIGEIEGFVKDYKITACTSLLKWVLSMVANERPVFVESGKISINLVVFALNRCKEYLFRKQNKDIDRAITNVSAGQWNAFLKKYYRIIAKDDVFQADRENKLSLYLGYAKILLKEIHKYRPQLSCEGCHNIWIIKPTHCSRGRGIRMASKLGVITNLLNGVNAKYVIQKYIEEPLLIHETKFDIRQYYLVTSTYPLVIWMYKDCYLKFSSQKYNLKNYHESIHLTNNAVQRKYKNSSGRHSDLPQNNMWDLEKYKNYLNMIGRNKVWDNIIYPGMKKSIIGIMLSCQDSMSVCKNRFELYGCDFILDKEYKPWLIEINSCPDLKATTHITEKIGPAVIADIIKVVIDHASDSNSPTGKFECIYRQPMTIPRYGGNTDLIVRGCGLNNEYFYKGDIEIKESYEDADIGKERDLKIILNKLKTFYDTDIMVEPDDDCDSKMVGNNKHEAETQNTESEFELTVAATIITDQLEELMDRITSEHSGSTKSVQLTQESVINISKSETPLQGTKSVTDIKSLIMKSVSRSVASMEAIGAVKKSFIFSQLDDGPSGKGSVLQLKSLLCSSDRSSSNINVALKSEENKVVKPYVNLLEATDKIISFINDKEREYFMQMYKNQTSTIS